MRYLGHKLLVGLLATEEFAGLDESGIPFGPFDCGTPNFLNPSIDIPHVQGNH